MQQAMVRSLIGRTRIPHAKGCGQKRSLALYGEYWKEAKEAEKSRVEQLLSRQRLVG